MRKLKANKQALSTIADLFLKTVFTNDVFPESITNGLKWVMDELLSKDPDEELLEAVRKEFLKGEYLRVIDICRFPYKTFREAARKNYGYNDEAIIPLVIKFFNMRRYAAIPVIILIQKIGTEKAGVSEYLHEKYDWTQPKPYTTRPHRTSKETGYYFITDGKFDAIPKKEMMTYAEGHGLRYCVTRPQLNMSDFCIVSPSEFQMIKEQYRDRPVYPIVLNLQQEAQEKWMQERGYTEMEIATQMKQENEALKNLQTDVAIDVEDLTPADIGETVIKLTQSVIDMHVANDGLLTIHVSDINWDMDSFPIDPEDEEPNLPTEWTISDLHITEFLNQDDKIDEDFLYEGVSRWLSDTFFFRPRWFSVEIIDNES